MAAADNTPTPAVCPAARLFLVGKLGIVRRQG
jgi:hypothetical protein